MITRRGPWLALLALTMLFVVTACSPPPPPPPANTLTTPKPGATPSATPASGFSKEDANPDPNFDMGYTVLITDSGFHPQWLVAPCCAAVTWKNTTSSPVKVAFNAVVGGSGTAIPPGGTYVFVPQNIESIAYHSGENAKMTGVVQVTALQQ
ncbi:MAG: hypothetical protein JOZ75_04635 [Candidatus Dormibacteraeota bacterium]|nr:hypothetical protein [Candidatus Dormibacteraeota bacterium]